MFYGSGWIAVVVILILYLGLLWIGCLIVVCIMAIRAGIVYLSLAQQAEGEFFDHWFAFKSTQLSYARYIGTTLSMSVGGEQYRADEIRLHDLDLTIRGTLRRFAHGLMNVAAAIAFWPIGLCFHFLYAAFRSFMS